jgi:hypothetical protein
MKWNAFDLIAPAFKKTKSRVLPFNFKDWFMLGLISLFSHRVGSSFGFPGSSSQESSGKTFDQMKENVRDYVVSHGVFLGLIFSFLLFIGLIFHYISSVLSFSFIELSLNKNNKFQFSKYRNNGLSLFLFRTFFGVLSTIFFLSVLAPIIYNFLKGNNIVASLGWTYIVFAIIFLIVIFIFVGLLLLFVNDFVVALMYNMGAGAFYSWKAIWKYAFGNKKETFIYWLARLVVGICTGILFGLILIVTVLLLFIVGLVILLIGFILYLLLGGHIIWVVLGIIILFILVLLFIIVIITLSAPLAVYNQYFYLLGFEKLTKIRILK